MYTFIIDPINNNNIKINSSRGKKILKKYLIILLGGADNNLGETRSPSTSSPEDQIGEYTIDEFEDVLGFSINKLRKDNQNSERIKKKIRRNSLQINSLKINIESYITSSDLFEEWVKNINKEALFEIMELSISMAYGPDKGPSIINSISGKGEELIYKHSEVALDILRTNHELTTSIKKKDIDKLRIAIDNGQARQTAAKETLKQESPIATAAAEVVDEEYESTAKDVLNFFEHKIDEAQMVLNKWKKVYGH